MSEEIGERELRPPRRRRFAADHWSGALWHRRGPRLRPLTRNPHDLAGLDGLIEAIEV